LSWNNENTLNDRAPINAFGILGMEDFNKIVLAGCRIMYNGQSEYFGKNSELRSENFFTINSDDAPTQTTSPRSFL
jgi:hypothetical protein